MSTFNERTSLRFRAQLRSGPFPVAPNTVHYKLMNLTRNLTLIDWTSVTPSADVVIDIDAQLLNVTGRRNEQIEITIVSDKDTEEQVTKELSVELMNRRAFG